MTLFLLLGLLQSAPLLETSPAQELERYRSSPLEVRRQLRQDLLQGVSTEVRIRNIMAASGDQSFDGLRQLNAGSSRGISLQEQGFDCWESGNYDDATRFYHLAYNQFSKIGARSEAAFCLYYISEILAEQELYFDSLNWNRSALEEIKDLDCILLSALLWESRGYSTWFTDNLAESVHAFSKALMLWNRTGYRSGIAAAWNNLAALFEEVGHLKRAEQYYKTAISTSGQDVLPEVKFQLSRNLALLFERAGRHKEALESLEEAKEFAATAPLEYRLAAARIKRDLESIEGIDPRLPGPKAETAMIRAELLSDQGQNKEAETVLRAAIDEASNGGGRYYRRRLTLKLASLFEDQGRFSEATLLYMQFMARNPPLAATEVLFPVSDLVSPFLKGWIRCQVQLGNPELARRGIHTLTRVRRQKARRLLSIAPILPTLTREIDQIIHLEPFLRSEEQEVTTKWKLETVPKINPRDFTLVEMWPDGKQVFVWLDTSDRNYFFVRESNQPIADKIHRTMAEFFSPEGHLPNLPPESVMASLAHQTIAPLTKYIPTARLLVLAHQELQNFPFEMLPLSESKLVIDRYILSYLPSLKIAKRPPPANRGRAGIVVAPEVFKNGGRFTRGSEAAFLQRIYPGTRVVESWNWRESPEVPWIHVSSHFRMGPHLWTSSRLEAASGAQGIVNLLGSSPRCRLLSMAVCDSANSFISDSPYWLNFGELFLLAGAGSLVASRWQLDHFSAEIFEEFFAYCRQGKTIDEALTLARNRFRLRRLKRYGVETDASHPFLWAGICFVGWPNSYLFEPTETEESSQRTRAGLTLMILSLAAIILRNQRKR